MGRTQVTQSWMVSYSQRFHDTRVFYMEHLWNIYFANLEPIKCAR